MGRIRSCGFRLGQVNLQVQLFLSRLERENDQLAQQLLTSKISMMADIDRLEDLKVSFSLAKASTLQDFSLVC